MKPIIFKMKDYSTVNNTYFAIDKNRNQSLFMKFKTMKT